MAHTVAFKLSKAASQFQAGESIGFGIRGGVKYYDRKTKTDKWTNYQTVVFAKTTGQIDYYNNNLIEGAVVTVSGDTIGVDEFDGPKGKIITLELNNARIEHIASPAANNAQHEAVKHAGPMRQQTEQFNSFDDDIPF